MRDYAYPSVFFAYFYFFLLMAGALFFFFRTRKDGYWGGESEEAKFRMMRDEEGESMVNGEGHEGESERRAE